MIDDPVGLRIALENPFSSEPILPCPPHQFSLFTPPQCVSLPPPLLSLPSSRQQSPSILVRVLHSIPPHMLTLPLSETACTAPCLANPNYDTCPHNSNLQCLCTNQVFIANTTACFTASCNATDLAIAEKVAQESCAKIVRESIYYHLPLVISHLFRVLRWLHLQLPLPQWQLLLRRAVLPLPPTALSSPSVVLQLF